jgi:putative phosphoesterase
MLIGIISDTHGYVDPRVAPAFAGVAAILHAGDVGGTHVLDELRAIAPVHAVYGNNDEKLAGRPPLGLPFRLDVALGGVRFHVVHQLPHAQPPPGTHVIVAGHSHHPLIERAEGGPALVNPGAAGRAGFHRIQTVALIEVGGGDFRARIVELGPREPRLARSPRPVR